MPSAVRVGFLIDRWDPARGGAEACLARLAAHLAQRGSEIVVYARTAVRGMPGRFRRVRAGLWFARARMEARFARSLVAAAREEGCQVTIGIRHLPEVDLFWPHGGSHLASVQAWNEAHRRSPDRFALSRRHRLFLELERRLLECARARRVVCVSRAVRDEIAALYPAARERLEIVPNGIDLDGFRLENRDTRGRALRETLELAPREILLAFVARDPVLKGLPVLLEALAGIRALPWRLVAAGAKRGRLLGRQCDRLGIGERVRFLPLADMQALLAAADLTCLPTWRDTSSLVLLESLASGTPVITTSRAGEEGLLEEGISGSVVADPGDVAGLRARLEEWIGRIAGGEEPDRAAIRAAVSDRGEETWLARLEEIVLELERSKRAP